LPEVEQQIRLLMQLTDEYFPEDDASKRDHTRKRQVVATQHELLARCLSCRCDEERDDEAVKEFKTAIALAPTIFVYWLNYLRHLVGRNLLCAALEEINALDLRHLESEAEEGAAIIVNWALAYPEIGFGIRADILKHCLALVSMTKRGLLIVGGAFPRAPDGKWERTEIIRILCAGMYGSLSLEELCRREGIKETTYYQWRKRFLPA
jgi:hypothetical protein